MRQFLIVMALVLAPGLLCAQNWTRKDVINPMTDARSAVFILKGEIDNNGIGTINLGIVCTEGKFYWAGFSIAGMTFASSHILTTPVTMRIGNRLYNEDLILSEDRTDARIVKMSEIRDIDKAGGITMEFKDAFLTGHYAKFINASFTSELLSNCDGLVKKEKNKK